MPVNAGWALTTRLPARRSERDGQGREGPTGGRRLAHRRRGRLPPAERGGGGVCRAQACPVRLSARAAHAELLDTVAGGAAARLEPVPRREDGGGRCVGLPRTAGHGAARPRRVSR